jgi:hypothetical protein
LEQRRVTAVERLLRRDRTAAAIALLAATAHGGEAA